MTKNESTLTKRVIRSGALLAGTIFVGAIGSGVWETILSPLLTSLSRGFLSFLSGMSSAYADALHSRIATDTTDAYSQVPFAAVTALMLVIPFVLVQLTSMLLRFLGFKKQIFKLLNDPLPASSEPEQNAKQDSRSTKVLDMIGSFRRTTLGLTIAFAVVVAITGLYVAIRAKYTRQAAVYVERSLAILAPVLNEKERLQLYADYRAIESAASFYELHDKLQSEGVARGVKIPKFEPVGRK